MMYSNIGLLSISITILVLLIEVERVSSFTSRLSSSSRTTSLRTHWMVNQDRKDKNGKQKHSKKRSQGGSSRRPYYSYSYGLKTSTQWSRYFTEEGEETDCMMFLDVENIRGKSNFDSSHDEFMILLLDFIQRNDDWLNGRISCIMDHGSEPSALFLSANNNIKVSIIFSGPLCKADDVLVRDLQSFLFSKRNNKGKKRAKALIVTADNELMTRCRQSCHDPEYHQVQFIHPHTFLPYLVERQPDSDTKSQNNNANENNIESSFQDIDNSVLTPKMIGNLEEEIQLRGAMYETQMQLKLSSKKKNKKKKQGSPKERRKLEKRARMLCERLAQRPSQNIEQLITITPTMTPYEIEFQNEVLQQWQLLRQTAKRREMTGDRMLLAEHFRRILTSNYNATSPDTTTANHEDECLSYQHALHVQKLLNTNSYLSTTMDYRNNGDTKTNATTSGEALRVLVISDTHGMEEQLGDTLPEADVLIHLGDFSIDFPKYKIKNALQRLDHWLAKQPCSYKIVLRGNHDPPQWTFQASQTRYITRPQLVALAGGRFQVLCIPWISPRILASSWRKLSIDSTSNHVDIIASHSPPKNILDRTYSKTHAGCPTLRKKVETQMLVSGPPRVWMCGHIHEGRGYTLHTFQKQSSILKGEKETLIINAANANGGPAKFIEHGPILFDIPDSQQQQQQPIPNDNQESKNDKHQSIVTFIEPEIPFVPKIKKDDSPTFLKKTTNNGQQKQKQKQKQS